MCLNCPKNQFYDLTSQKCVDCPADKPVYEEVVLTLEKEKSMISNEALVEEIKILKEKVAALEKRSHQPAELIIPVREGSNKNDFEEETERKIRKLEEEVWRIQEEKVQEK